MHKNNDTTNALIIHLSAFFSYLFPFGGIIIPFLVWKAYKENSNFLDQHGKAAVNFNISYGILELILIISLIASVFGHILRLGSIAFVILILSFVGSQIARLILIIIAATKASKGEEYDYPFAIKFIK